MLFIFGCNMAKLLNLEVQKNDLLCMRVEDVLFTHYKTDVVPVYS